MTDKLLSLAQKCGGNDSYGLDPNSVDMNEAALTAFAAAIREEEREKGADFVLDLLVAAGAITREKAFQARDIARDLHYSNPGKSDE